MFRKVSQLLAGHALGSQAPKSVQCYSGYSLSAGVSPFP